MGINIELMLRDFINKGIDSNIKTLSSEELNNYVKDKSISNINDYLDKVDKHYIFNFLLSNLDKKQQIQKERKKQLESLLNNFIKVDDTYYKIIK